jgi:hypothetical protein
MRVGGCSPNSSPASSRSVAQLGRPNAALVVMRILGESFCRLHTFSALPGPQFMVIRGCRCNTNPAKTRELWGIWGIAGYDREYYQPADSVEFIDLAHVNSMACKNVWRREGDSPQSHISYLSTKTESNPPGALPVATSILIDPLWRIAANHHGLTCGFPATVRSSPRLPDPQGPGTRWHPREAT